MAELAAEYSEILHGAYAPNLTVVDQDVLDAVALADAVIGEVGWFSADMLPSVHLERRKRDEESQQIIDYKKEQLNEGNFEAVDYAYNILTTAQKLRLAKESDEVDNQEVVRLNRALWQDAKTHVAEAWRRLTYEYFPEIEQTFDAEKDSYVYEGYVVNEVADNGLSPVGSEEVGIDVLVADRRENYTANYIGKLGRLMLKHAGVDVAEKPITMHTVSQLDNSPQTMIRGLRIDSVNNTRYQEQVGFSKKYITTEVVEEGFKRLGIIESDTKPTQLDILGTQVVSSKGESVMSLMAVFDKVASETTGLNIFMGEKVPTGCVKDYEAIKHEAQMRQAKQDDDARALMAEIIRLESLGIDGWQATKMIDSFVTNHILDQVTENPEAARHVFGNETAARIEQSIAQRQLGNDQLADQLIHDARSNAPMATVCTGGSCDLKSVSSHNNEDLVAARRLGIKSEDMKNKMVSYDKGYCPSCQKTTKMYYNRITTDATCSNCASTKIGNTIIGKPKKNSKKSLFFAFAA